MNKLIVYKYAEIVLFERFLHFKYFINLLFISCLLFNKHYIIKNWHNCYYEKIGNKEYCINDEIPFDIPNNWIWTRLNNITTNISTKNYQIYQKEIKNSGKYPVVSQSSNLIEGYSDNNSKVLKIDFPIIIFGDHTKCLKYIDFDFIVGADGVKIIMPICLNAKFLYYLLSFIKMTMKDRGYSRHFQFIAKALLPIPPSNEQRRLLTFLTKTDNIFTEINNNTILVNNLSQQIKLKLLTDIFGENSSYKSYYEKEYTLNDLLPYEQPAKYIVKNTDYSNKYKTPVITPGKSFILGYTNEVAGIYKVKNKVIIFDDFTTASRLVDFNFKVKSSALKILKSSDENKFNIEYLFYLLQTIKVINNTHKRYWISEYAPKKLKIHTFDEQTKIVKNINKVFSILNCCD